MSLMNTLSSIFNNEVNVDAVSGATLANYENEVKKRIETQGGVLSEMLRNLNKLSPFFEYLKLESHREKTQSLYVWLLDWQLSTRDQALTQRLKHELSVTLLDLMKHFLQNKREDAIRYYESHKDALDAASPAVRRLMKDVLNEEAPVAVQTKTLEEWKAYFNIQLKGQAKQPTTILYLAIHYYQDPHAFAALIFWLFDKGVSPEKMIYSGLMHRFFEGHAPYLAESSAKNHPVSALYDVLRASAHPEAMALVSTAEKTCAYVADNLKPKKEKREMLCGFQAYNLMGQEHAKQAMASLVVLSKEQLHDPVVRVNPSPENVCALATVFSGAFLRLLAASRHVARQLTETQWQDYFNLVMSSAGDDIGTFPALFELHDLLKQYCFPLSVKVFARIFDLALLHQRELDEDVAFINKLRHLMCPLIRGVVFEKVNTLVLVLESQMPAQGAKLTLEGYRAIEDEWNKISETLIFIKSIYKTMDFSFFEENLYQLQAKLLVRYPNDNNVLDVMLASHGSEETVRQHEKPLLLEWMAREPDAENQNKIISRLFEKYQMTKATWDESDCAHDAFVMACRAGNVLFVSRALKGEISFFIPKEEILRGFIGAASHGREDVLRLMLEALPSGILSEKEVDTAVASVPLDQLKKTILLFQQQGDRVPSWGVIRDKFFLAAAEGMLDLVAYLCQLEGRSAFDMRDINRALGAAAACGQLEVIKHLCALPKSGLNRVNVTFAFEVSMRHAHFNVATYLCGLPVGLALSDESIHQMFLLAVMDANEDRLHCLLNCFKDRFQQDQNLFGFVFAVATHFKKWQRLVPLCRSSSSKLNMPRFIGPILSELINAGEVEVVAALCGITGEYGFDQYIFVETLKVAAAYVKLEFFKDVCELGGSEYILEVLKLSRDIHYGNHFYNVDDRRLISEAVFSLFSGPAVTPLKEAIVFKALHIAADESQLKFITAVCGLEAVGLLNPARIKAVLGYATMKSLDEVVKLITLKMMIRFSRCNEDAKLLLGCLRAALNGKTMPEKYQFIANCYCAVTSQVTLEESITLFNLIDQNNEALGIDTTPRKALWAPALFATKKPANDGNEWAAAWGKMRQSVFDHWKLEITDQFVLPGRKQALIALFEGCGNPNGPHHKLMGMGRTSGKPHSETSRLIEAEITKVRRELMPRLG